MCRTTWWMESYRPAEIPLWSAASSAPSSARFNATLDAVVGPLNVTAKYVDRIAKGDVPEKIADAYNGSFNEIKNNLNQCIDAFDGLVAESTALAKAAVDGELSMKADETRFHGKFRDVIHGMNNMLEAFVAPVCDVGDTLRRVANRDLSETVNADYCKIFLTDFIYKRVFFLQWLIL